MFNVTINDISVIYVTAHRCAGGLKKKLDLRSGSQRHRHFVGFFNVPVPSTDTGPTFLYGDSDTPPHLVALLRSRWGYGGAHSRLNPPGPHGGVNVRSSGHIKINVGPRAYKNRCWTAMTRLTSQASRFVLIPLCPKPIRPKLCQFVVRNLGDVDRCDGVRVNSH